MIRVFFVALAVVQWFGGAEKNTREGAEHLDEGRLEAALRAFSRAEGEYPDAPENDLNIAGVHYRMGEEEAAAAGPAADSGGEGGGSLAEAARGYQAALAGGVEGRLRRDGFFNLANTLFRAGAYREAAAAYGEAISLDPEDLEARQNLERALLQAEEQEQEQQQQQQGNGGSPEPQSGESGDEGQEDGQGGEPGEPPPSGAGEQQRRPEQGRQDGEQPRNPAGEGLPEGPPPPSEGASDPDPQTPRGADPEAADPGPVPEISPEQAERILAALAEVERAHQEARLAKRRVRALRRGRH